MRIDSHQHFWKLSRGYYNWLTPELKILYKDFMPNELLNELKEHKIDKTILVQAANSIEETYYMFELMKENDFIAGVVGWLDFESDDFKEQLLSLMQEKGFVGLRPMLQDIPDDRWVLKEKVIENIKVMHELQVPLDILIYPKHLTVIQELLEKIPDLKCVINHLAKPKIKDNAYNVWSKEIGMIARYPNVYCKISGVITEADHKYWNVEKCRKYIIHCVNIFTEDRIMFGSDWPICLLAGSYTDVYNTTNIVIEDMLSENGLNKFYSNNAQNFYNRIRRVEKS